MKNIIDNAIRALTNISDLAELYIHTFRKQGNLTLELLFNKDIEKLSLKARAALNYDFVQLNEHNTKLANIILPYATHTMGYGEDLETISNRTLKTWSQNFVNSLLASKQEKLLDSNLIHFYWATGRGKHSLGTNLERILEVPDESGKILDELPLQYGATLALCEYALIYYDEQETVSITHDSIEKISFSTYELLLVTKKRPYQFNTLEADKLTETHMSDYFDRIIKQTRPDNFNITNTKDIPKNKSVEFYIALFLHYYQPGENDREKLSTACAIAKIGLNLYPDSIRLLDTSTMSFLLIGNSKEQYHYFLKCAEYHTTIDSLIWKNVIANTINSVIMLGDKEQMQSFFDRHYHPDHLCSPRIYFHNMACLIVLLDTLDEFEPCMEQAIARAETALDITTESDFDSLHNSNRYQRIVDAATRQDQKRGDEKRVEPMHYSVYDYSQMYRLDESNPLFKIAKQRNLQADTFLQDLAVDKFTDSDTRLKAFYLLIALAGDKNLAVAKKAYHQFNYVDEYECAYNFSNHKVDVLNLVSDKDIFKKDLKDIMSDTTELLPEID